MRKEKNEIKKKLYKEITSLKKKAFFFLNQSNVLKFEEIIFTHIDYMIIADYFFIKKVKILGVIIINFLYSSSY